MQNKGERVLGGIFIFYVVVLVITIYFHSLSGYRGPFKGRVIDQDTLQPISEAVIHVDWDLAVIFDGRSYFDSKEVLTDKNGYFYIPQNWSFNPWNNLVMMSDCVIYKRGYGYFQGYTDRLDLTARNSTMLTDEERAKYGPRTYFKIVFDGDLPVFLLKRITTKEEYQDNWPVTVPGLNVPESKKKLIMNEFKK